LPEREWINIHQVFWESATVVSLHQPLECLVKVFSTIDLSRSKNILSNNKSDSSQDSKILNRSKRSKYKGSSG